MDVLICFLYVCLEFNWCNLYFIHFILNIIFVPMPQAESRSINVVVVVVFSLMHSCCVSELNCSYVVMLYCVVLCSRIEAIRDLKVRQRG